MIRVVLDTSVLVSAVISSGGPNARLFDAILAGTFKPYVTEAVVDEYTRVFSYERLKHLDKRRIARLRGALLRVALMVKPSGRLRLSGHEDDNRIYECAAAARAHYIVTENTRHFNAPYKTTRIVTARQLLALIEPL